ncbi:MAG TPA: flavodoxin domain-containing protein, partial [Ktedonobacterales bacterium]|nr:flavodoxin domain-containing protein [Ktedonobacterales bacterium]
GKETTMPRSVLVTYATRYGSTQEVAEAIAKTLGDSGLTVDFQPMRNVRGLDQYGAVVLGAPLYMFHWHKDAIHFLARHREALATRPVAIFALGPLHDDEKEFHDVREQLDKELAAFSWLTPKAIEIVGGKFDPEKLTFPHNLIPALKHMPASDIRDWTKIRGWAERLAHEFAPELASRS